MNEEVVVTFIADLARYNAEVRESRAETAKLADEARRASKEMSTTERRMRGFADTATDVKDVVRQVENLTRSSQQLNAVLTSKARGQFSPEVLHALEMRAQSVDAQLGKLTGTTRNAARSLSTLDAGAGAIVAKGPRLRDSLGGAATATSGLASASAGATGRIHDMVGAADNLLVAFAVGGPLALGVTAIASGVGYGASQWLEYKEAQKQAEEGARAIAREIETQFNTQLEEARVRLEDLTQQVLEFGKTGGQVTLFRAQQENQAAQKARNFLLEDERRLLASIAEQQEIIDQKGVRGGAERARESAREEKRALDAKLASIQTQLQDAEDIVTTTSLEIGQAEILIRKHQELEETRKNNRDRQGETTEAVRAEADVLGWLGKMRRDAMAEGARRRAAARQAELDTIEMERIEDLERQKILWQAEFEAFDAGREVIESADSASLGRRALEHDKFLAERVARERAAAQEASSFIVGIATLTGESFAAVLSGRAGAEREILKSILDLVGTEMAAKGTLFALEGTARLVGGDPSGALVAALGGAMIFGGAALKAGSVPLVDSLLGGGGGAIAGSSTSPSSPGGGGLAAPSVAGSGGSTTLVINVHNGVGIAPEATRRAIAQGIRDAVRAGDLRREEISVR